MNLDKTWKPGDFDPVITNWWAVSIGMSLGTRRRR
jgi:hypothetical protein